jgi:hypothetical protein
MAKKKMTRDVPLPSSDGMFGGPGDPKKKYTASDSANYMGTYNRQQASFKKAYESMNSMMENSKRDRMDDTMRKNPFHSTFTSRNKK